MYIYCWEIEGYQEITWIAFFMVWYLSIVGGFLTADVIGLLNSMLRRGFMYGSCEKLHVFEEVLSQADIWMWSVLNRIRLIVLFHQN